LPLTSISRLHASTALPMHKRSVREQFSSRQPQTLADLLKFRDEDLLNFAIRQDWH
jgi:hypothetical protein